MYLEGNELLSNIGDYPEILTDAKTYPQVYQAEKMIFLIKSIL